MVCMADKVYPENAASPVVIADRNELRRPLRPQQVVAPAAFVLYSWLAWNRTSFTSRYKLRREL